MPRYIRRDDYECSVVNQRVTVAILTGDVQPGLPQADQMRHCNFAHVCGKFGDPPLLSRFSSAERIGCPYHDNLNTSVKPASSINGSPAPMPAPRVRARATTRFVSASASLISGRNKLLSRVLKEKAPGLPGGPLGPSDHDVLRPAYWLRIGSSTFIPDK
jgi:hypothetical protein